MATSPVDYSSVLSGFGTGGGGDPTALDLPGELTGMPGGGASDGTTIVADPSGSTAIYTDPSADTGASQGSTSGNWMSLASQIAQSATQAFTTYERGSPSVATPVPKPTSTSILKPASAVGPTVAGFQMSTILLIVAGGILAFVLLR